MTPDLASELRALATHSGRLYGGDKGTILNAADEIERLTTRLAALEQAGVTPRERLAAAIAAQDAERGRPLTDRERLDNLDNAIINGISSEDSAALAPAPIVQGGEAAKLRDAIIDCTTHERPWIEALEAVRNQATEDADRSYWEHEIGALKRTLLILGALQPPAGGEGAPYVHPFHEGQRAHESAKSEYDNPYTDDQWERTAWQHGWDVANEVNPQADQPPGAA